ncbi:SPFH domain-containing protein [Parafrankia sp. EUN1f]|uniref:SPFH domain-containing protein n=1 Tax=Parafrankia sp. EUN1f TaxID=102897 RepID=UPI0001C452F8|nr:SPFH domain-containing protein [Parafrankia sp. EUN1f]EFC78999.1 band 7 protein [Parafrankia sp. EUN1f]
MPKLFVTAIVFAVLTLLPLTASILTRKAAASTTDTDLQTLRREGARAALGVAVLFAGLAVLFTVLSSVTSVSTKKVGIVTSFGRPTGTVLSNGLHGKLPWQKVTPFDAAIQTDSYAPEPSGSDREGNEIVVRTASQSTAYVSASARWRINPGSADDLFVDYRGFDNVRASLVTRDLRAAMNDVFSTYNPLGGDAVPSYDNLSKQVTKALSARVGAPVEVQSVVISHVAFDKTTQDRINALQGEVAQTRIATQREATAAAEAKANETLSASVSQDPNVLVSQCMTLLRAAVDKGQQLPAGFSCWPGAGAEFAVTR